MKSAASNENHLPTRSNFSDHGLPVSDCGHWSTMVLNFNYLQRSLVPQIKRTRRPGGWVIFETYLTDQSKIGPPISPDYLLLHNELLDFFRDFRVLYYSEGKFLQLGEGEFRAGLLAQKGS